ncbi:MAG: hypothetical protein O2U61_06695, partial [Candidatus Bathyarchaeota archaeon]|nr:hypothetical protein [Candidatus Bathyarchaeota archaeon]
NTDFTKYINFLETVHFSFRGSNDFQIANCNRNQESAIELDAERFFPMNRIYFVYPRRKICSSKCDFT